jgi:hypothetical protein
MPVQHSIQFFGQPPPAFARLSPIARCIVARINAGRPATIAGFMWQLPSPAGGANIVPGGVLLLTGAEEAA